MTEYENIAPSDFTKTRGYASAGIDDISSRLLISCISLGGASVSAFDPERPPAVVLLAKKAFQSGYISFIMHSSLYCAHDGQRNFLLVCSLTSAVQQLHLIHLSYAIVTSGTVLLGVLRHTGMLC